MNVTISNGNYVGNISIPGSKSDAQRVILAAALSTGKSFLTNVGNSNDEVAMLKAVQKLGAKVSFLEEGIEIEGVSYLPDNLQVDIGESGLATRLLSGIFAFSRGNQSIVGHDSALRRRFNFFPKHFGETNYQISTAEDCGLPLTFVGQIEKQNLKVNGGESSQDISGLLYGIAFANRNCELEVIHLKSRPYVQMTMDTLSDFGIHIEHEDLEYFHLTKNGGFRAHNHHIEGDWSSASYWLIAAVLGKQITISGLQYSSLQADKQLLTILTNANCTLLRGDFLTVDGTEREALDVDLTNCPDLFPALTAYASLTPGVSKLHGTHRLLNKESNRAEVLMEEFQKLGCHCLLDNDTMIIEGKDEIEGGIIVDSHNDHRIAMCLAVVGLFTKNELVISNAEAVNKSYPRFWDDLHRLSVSN